MFGKIQGSKFLTEFQNYPNFKLKRTWGEFIFWTIKNVLENWRKQVFDWISKLSKFQTHPRISKLLKFQNISCALVHFPAGAGYRPFTFTKYLHLQHVVSHAPWTQNIFIFTAKVCKGVVTCEWLIISSFSCRCRLPPLYFRKISSSSACSFSRTLHPPRVWSLCKKCFELSWGEVFIFSV
jgi:hypothetical protein